MAERMVSKKSLVMQPFNTTSEEMLFHMDCMQKALSEARMAFDESEVPVGAVLLSQTGETLATAHNRIISLSDPTAHAEILVLRSACEKIRNYRLLNTTLYVTIEPCVMCMGAIIHARVQKLVYGAGDPKWGAAGSLYDFSADNRLNHHTEIISGVCEDECREIIQRFFKCKRSGGLMTTAQI